MELLLSIDAWLGLATLTFFEIVLGIDNVIFISITTNKLRVEDRAKARNFGLTLALVVRIMLLLTISWMVHFSEPLFSVGGFSFSLRDLILGFGGMFLIAKSTNEINHNVDDRNDTGISNLKNRITIQKAVIQIILLDIVFSFDSILTAVGLTNTISIMITAIIIAMILMIFFSGAIGTYIQRHPSLEVLALGFLILIGFVLLLEAFHYQIPKGYIYFAVGFSLVIEIMNLRVRARREVRNEAKVISPAAGATT
jgi:predicted tellurium resistance membrane protein TerC